MSEEPGQASGGDDRQTVVPLEPTIREATRRAETLPPDAGRGRGATGGSYSGRGDQGPARSGRPPVVPGTIGVRRRRRAVMTPVAGQLGLRTRAPGIPARRTPSVNRASGTDRGFGSDRSTRAEGSSSGSWSRSDRPRRWTSERTADVDRDGPRTGAPAERSVAAVGDGWRPSAVGGRPSRGGDRAAATWRRAVLVRTAAASIVSVARASTGRSAGLTRQTFLKRSWPRSSTRTPAVACAPCPRTMQTTWRVTS